MTKMKVKTLIIIFFVGLVTISIYGDIVTKKPDNKEKSTTEMPVLKTQYRVMMPSYIENGPYFTKSFKFENGILTFIDNRTGRLYYIQGGVAVEELK